MVSLRDILIGGIISWFIKKLLDFLWEKGKRVRFEGKTHIGHYLFVMFGERFLLFMFGWLLGTPEGVEETEIQDLVIRIVKLHRRFHQFVGNEPCSVCDVVACYRGLLEKMVSDPELYPPFNF